MNNELIAAILKLADAQNAIATQIGRIADQITPSANEITHPGNFANYMAYVLTSAGTDYSEELRMIADAIEKRAED